MARQNKSQIIIETGTKSLLKKYKLITTGNLKTGTIWCFDTDVGYYVDAGKLIDIDMENATGVTFTVLVNDISCV